MNQRSVLGMTATTTIGLSLSHARIFAQASGPGPEMSALSAYMSAAGTRALAAEAAEHAKYHLLDTLASMISGSKFAARRGWSALHPHARSKRRSDDRPACIPGRSNSCCRLRAIWLA